MPNPRVSVQFTVDSTGYTAAVNKAKAQMIDFGEATKRVHHTAVTDVQATSGALRLLDGGIQNNIRSAERFLAGIKGVGAAVQAIYPAVGLIAVGAVIGRGVVELTNFIKKTQEAGATFKAEFQEMVNTNRLANDELAKTNINLENEIAKLTGKHQNVLASQLIEARIEADKLAISVAAAAKQIKELLDKNAAGILALAMGSGTTGDTFGNINNFQSQKRDATQAFEDARHGGDAGGAAAAQARFAQLVKNERAYYKQQIADLTATTTMTERVRDATGGDRMVTRQVPKVAGDQTRNLTALRSALQLNYEQGDRLDEDAQNVKDTGGLKDAQDAKAAAERYRTEQEKAARALKQNMDEQLAAMKQDHLVNVAEESEFWRKSLDAVKGGSTPMLALRVEINKRLAELSQEQRRNLLRFQNERLPESIKPETDEREIREQARIAEEQNAAQERAGTSAARQQAAYEEAVISLKLATGEISKLDAAQESAAIHAREYAAEIAAIQQSLQFWANAPDSPEKTRGVAEGQQQLSDVGSAAKLSDMEDRARIAAQSPFGAWRDALNQFVQQSRDTASQVRDIWSSALSGVNDEIVKVISTRHNYNTRVEFGNLGAGMFRNVAGAALQKGEGALLGAFGLGGKPDGSESKPLHVIIAGSKHAIAGAGAGVTGMVKDAVSDAGGWLGKVGGFASKIFSGLGFADGGMPPVGMASLVGESGPELFVPKVAGTVIPNSEMGSRTPDIHLHLDARGASDPTAMEAAANRAIMKAMPHIAAATTHAQQNGRSRMPSSRRS